MSSCLDCGGELSGEYVELGVCEACVDRSARAAFGASRGVELPDGTVAMGHWTEEPSPEALAALWDLAVAVRKRFAEEPTAPEPATFTGVRCEGCGRAVPSLDLEFHTDPPHAGEEEYIRDPYHPVFHPLAGTLRVPGRWLCTFCRLPEDDWRRRAYEQSLREGSNEHGD